MSGFKQHLELAQSFQNEMAGVDGVSVTVSVYSPFIGKEDLGGNFVVVTASGDKEVVPENFLKEVAPEHFFQLIGDKITAESLTEIKTKLGEFSYEI